MAESLVPVDELEYIEADGDYVELNGAEVMEAEVSDDNDETWDHASIKTMLTVYLQHKDKFRNPKIKKKSVWTEISSVIRKTPESCDRKYRNLKQTYIRLLKRKNTNGDVHVKWPYFDIFEEIYNENGEYQPEIQIKLQGITTDSVAKALLSFSNTPTKFENAVEYGESSTSQQDEYRRKLNKKRFVEFRKATTEMKDRQRAVEEKLDKLIRIVEESNVIQKERNMLFEQFLEKLQQNP